MTIFEFFHPGYLRWGLRAQQLVNGAELYYEILKQDQFGPFTSEEVFEFSQLAEYRLHQWASNHG